MSIHALLSQTSVNKQCTCIYLTQVFDRTVASDSKDALAEWMKYASPEGTYPITLSNHTKLFIMPHRATHCTQDAEVSRIFSS